MRTDGADSESRRTVRAHRGPALVYCIFSLLAFAFAALVPVMFALRSKQPLVPLNFFVLLTWASFPGGIGLFLLYHATRRVELTCSPGEVSQTSHWLGLRFTKTRPIDRATVIRHQGPKNPHIDTVLIITSGRRKRHLTGEGFYELDLIELLDWIGRNAEVPTYDARQRKPLGD